FVFFHLQPARVEDGDFTVALQGGQVLVALGILHGHGIDIAVLDGAAGDRLDVVLDERARRHTTGVERTHRKLRARFADRLGGDDSDRQTFFDDIVGGHVDAVAAGTNTARAFARQRRANADAFQLEILELVGDLIGDRLVFFDDRFIVDRIADRVAGGSAENHVLQFLFNRFTFVDGGLGDAVHGAAIDLVDDHVLGDVGELAGQVTGVGGLQGGVGQSL